MGCVPGGLAACPESCLAAPPKGIASYAAGEPAWRACHVSRDEIRTVIGLSKHASLMGSLATRSGKSL